MKIDKFLNKKEGNEQYRARFEMNGKTFRPVADTRKKLLEMIDEIRAQEHRVKFDLPVAKYYRTVKEIFDEHLRRLKKSGDRKKIAIFERVSEKLMKMLPPDIKINQLKKGHFQQYIDQRLSESNPKSKTSILPETINKERSALVAAFRDAHLYFPELEGFDLPDLPKAKTKSSGAKDLSKWIPSLRFCSNTYADRIATL